MIAGIFGVLLLALFASLPLLRPVVARGLIAPGTMKGAVLLAGLATAYVGLFLFLFVELLLALSHRRVWPLHVERPGRLVILLAATFGLALLLITPMVILGGATRRAAARFAASRGLPFQADGGPWRSDTHAEPWTLQSKIALADGGFIATALARHRDRISRDASYTYWTLGVLPRARCPARGLVRNNQKYRSSAEPGEEALAVAGCEVFVPRDAAAHWRPVLEAAAAAAPALFPELLFATCDDRGLTVALAATLRRDHQYADLEQMLRRFGGETRVGGR